LKSVAIFGFAPQTRDAIHQSDAQEVWALNNFYNYGLEEKRVTRTFEMHELWMQAVYAFERTDNIRGKYYWDWLRSPHPFPIYMAKVKQDFVDEYRHIKTLDVEAMDDIDKQKWGMKLREIEVAFDFFKDNHAEIRRYPLEAIIDEFMPVIAGLDKERFPERGILPYFVSSIDYMSALAIYEGFERIEYYGVELREKTEWAMQKSGATFWAGIAMGRGIEIVIPKNSVLISAPLYGIDTGAQMIPVQVPEELRRQLNLEFDRQRNMHNHYTGQYTKLGDELRIAGADGREADVQRLKEDMAKVQKEADGAVIRMYLAEGGMNAMSYIINHEDFKLAPLSLETITHLEYIAGENEPQKAEQDAAVPVG